MTLTEKISRLCSVMEQMQGNGFSCMIEIWIDRLGCQRFIMFYHDDLHKDIDTTYTYHEMDVMQNGTTLETAFEKFFKECTDGFDEEDLRKCLA